LNYARPLKNTGIILSYHGFARGQIIQQAAI